MNIREVAEIVEGNLVCEGLPSDSEVLKAFASDLMSDVLMLDTHSLLLITGLSNVQTIRTAEMADIKNILFVRDKKPTEEMIDLARKEGINIVLSKKSMYACCGLLFQAALKPVY